MPKKKKKIKLLSWNVNGLRAVIKKDFFASFHLLDADIFAIQETKIQENQLTDEMKNIPLGAVGIYSYSEKIKVGLQQLMAGARSFSVPVLSRKHLMSLTEECAKVTGIPYLMDCYREEAMEILG